MGGWLVRKGLSVLTALEAWGMKDIGDGDVGGGDWVSHWEELTPEVKGCSLCSRFERSKFRQNLVG